MLNIFKKKSKDDEKVDILTKTASLLIHAAKIDQNYTNKEKLIIEKTLLELGAKEQDIKETMISAEKSEKQSNQIIDFTKDIKNTNQDFKNKNYKNVNKRTNENSPFNVLKEFSIK